jgi:hypothetical protein
LSTHHLPNLSFAHWRNSIIVFCLAFALYGVSSGLTLFRQSLAPHYVYLAYSLSHGLSYLEPLPPTNYDLLLFNNHWYVAGSPLPAILLIPWVALRGLSVSDILFGVLMGALNVALMYGLLGRLRQYPNIPLPITEAIQRWLTLLFAAGTAHWYIASLGSVWFNAHVVAVTFLILYVWETLGKKRGWLAGSWLALAMLARPTALFAAAFYLIYIALQPLDRRTFLRQLVPFFALLAFGVALSLLFNAIRFGNPFDFGYAYVQGAANITESYARYGGFNLRYLPCNLYVSLVGLPDVGGQFSPAAVQLCSHLLPDGALTAGNPWLSPNPLGMSLFLVTPAFIYLFRARQRIPVVMAAWVGLLAVAVPLWLYHNTGSLQFGYRYSLDAAPFWMILMAAGLSVHFGRTARALILLSVLINFLGMVWMFNAFTGLNWFGMWR